jgi:hypothetical protein
MVQTIATVALAIVGVLGLIGAAITWIFKLSSSLNRNTEATEDLAAQVGGLRVTLESHTQILTEHHFRLKALEDREVKVIVK